MSYITTSICCCATTGSPLFHLVAGVVSNPNTVDLTYTAQIGIEGITATNLTYTAQVTIEGIVATDLTYTAQLTIGTPTNTPLTYTASLGIVPATNITSKSYTASITIS
jgi:hypothetical protein